MSFLELDGFRRNVRHPIRSRERFLIALQLKTCSDFDLSADGRLIRPRQVRVLGRVSPAPPTEERARPLPQPSMPVWDMS